MSETTSDQTVPEGITYDDAGGFTAKIGYGVIRCVRSTEPGIVTSVPGDGTVRHILPPQEFAEISARVVEAARGDGVSM